MTRCTVALAVIALGALAHPAAGFAARGMEIAVQDDAALVRDPWAYQGRGASTLPSSARALSAARSIGASAVRFNVLWDRVSPGGGAPDFRRLDRAVDRARARGLRVQLTITGPAPAGATVSGAPGIVDPLPEAYARFAAATASHFAARVRRFSIWNEPNWPTSLQPSGRAAAIYRRLYEAAEPAIRRAAPGAQVLFGELAPMGRPEAAIAPLRFVRDVFACNDCPPLVTDGIALHPYTLRWSPLFPGPAASDVTLGSLDRLTRATDRLVAAGALRSATGRRLDLYLTEYGFHADSPSIPEPLRSHYAVQAFSIALAHRRVRQLLWYQLVQPPASGRVHIWDTALVTRAGRVRPTHHALRVWARDRRGAIARPMRRRGVGRNDPCWCGSGKRLKQRHGA